MNLQKIDFNHFFLEIVEHAEKQDICFINPNVMSFYKIGNIYLALTSVEGILTINFAINTGKLNKDKDIYWINILKKEAEDNNYKAVRFLTSVNNKMTQNIASQFDGNIIKTAKNYYLDGSDALIYEFLINKGV